MNRKASFSSRGRGNGRPVTATLSPMALPTAAKSFVEFHPSMSLENAPTLADCLSSAPTATSSQASRVQLVSSAGDATATLEDVLAARFDAWSRVNDVIEKLAPLEAYQGDVHALQKLQKLHLLCKQRETHLRTLQIALLQEGRTIPREEAEPTTEIPAETEDAKTSSILLLPTKAKATSESNNDTWIS